MRIPDSPMCQLRAAADLMHEHAEATGDAVALGVAAWLHATHKHFDPIWRGPCVPDKLALALNVARAYLDHGDTRPKETNGGED